MHRKTWGCTQPCMNHHPSALNVARGFPDWPALKHTSWFILKKMSLLVSIVTMNLRVRGVCDNILKRATIWSCLSDPMWEWLEILAAVLFVLQESRTWPKCTSANSATCTLIPFVHSRNTAASIAKWTRFCQARRRVPKEQKLALGWLATSATTARWHSTSRACSPGTKECTPETNLSRYSLN